MARNRVFATSERQRVSDGATVQYKVYRDSDTQEYIVRLYIKGKLYAPADYFTSDKGDAISTACGMLAFSVIK